MIRSSRICSNGEIKNMAHEYVSEDVTIRGLSAKYEVARSTIHRYFQEALASIDSELAEEVRRTARRKQQEGRRRGGCSLQEKMKKEKSENGNSSKECRYI